MALKTEEKLRRKGKKNHELLDDMILKVLEGDNAEEVFQAWALADPKGFMTLAKDRSPRVQPVDQDLQKTHISLKSIMYDLPEVEDVLGENKNLKSENKKLTTENSNLTEQVDFLNKKMQKMREKYVKSDNN